MLLFNSIIQEVVLLLFLKFLEWVFDSTQIDTDPCHITTST